MTSRQRKTLSPLRTPTLGHFAARMGFQDGRTKWNATKPLTRQRANAMQNLGVQLQRWRRSAGQDGLQNTANVTRDICAYIEESSLGCREICIIVARVRCLRRGRSNTTDVVSYFMWKFDLLLTGEGYHGRPKQRIYEGHYWTHTSRGGAFGRKIWKKWFNNRAMNRLEARIRQDQENQRKGCERYSMRKLKPKAVNSKVARDSKAYIWNLKRKGQNMGF